MMRGGHGQTNQLHDINWGALQLMSCNYYVCVCVLVELRRKEEGCILDKYSAHTHTRFLVY